MLNGMSVFGQNDGYAWLGGNYIYGRGNGHEHSGWGVKFLGGTEKVRMAIEFDFFHIEKGTVYGDVSLYGHYIFSAGEKFKIYPSIGIGMVDKDDAKNRWWGVPTTYFAGSYGGGVEFYLTSNLNMNLEYRYKLFHGNFLGGYHNNFIVGMSYRFKM